MKDPKPCLWSGSCLCKVWNTRNQPPPSSAPSHPATFWFTGLSKWFITGECFWPDSDPYTSTEPSPLSEASSSLGLHLFIEVCFFPFFFLQKIDCHKFCPSKSLVTEWSCPQSHLFILVSTFIKWFPILIILSMAFHTAATLMQHFITCPGGCWQLSISRLHSNFNFLLFLFFALTPFPYLLYFQKKRELDECSKRRGFPLPFNTQTL